MPSSGEMTPPCGVPSDVAVNAPWSITPDLSQALICCLTFAFDVKLLEQYFMVDAVKAPGYIRV